MSAPSGVLSKKNKEYVIQAVLMTVTILIIWVAISSARTNLDALGISSGFGFLDRGTGWSYSFSLIERSIDDTYRRTLFIGFTNTLFLGLFSIVLATLLGFLIGTMRDAKNIATKSAATTFVQIFRNIPLILQLVFWYAMLIHMPGPRQSFDFFSLAFLSNRGAVIPALNISAGVVIGIIAISAVFGFILHYLWKAKVSKKVLVWLVGTVIVTVFLTFVFSPKGEAMISVPELKGLRFVGGLNISVELVAMVIGIVLYGAAYIAEVVRGGLQEVPKGLVEAGQALGLNSSAIWFRIKMPMALRTIIPPLGNQWIFLMKATTIGVAIGFSDLFMIVSTSITQSGQTLELIGILMAAFLLVNFGIAQFVNLLNARMQLKGHS